MSMVATGIAATGTNRTRRRPSGLPPSGGSLVLDQVWLSPLDGGLWGRQRLIGISAGAFADPSFPAPTRSIWEQSRCSWGVAGQTARKIGGR